MHFSHRKLVGLLFQLLGDCNTYNIIVASRRYFENTILTILEAYIPGPIKIAFAHYKYIPSSSNGNPTVTPGTVSTTAPVRAFTGFDLNLQIEGRSTREHQIIGFIDCVNHALKIILRPDYEYFPPLECLIYINVLCQFIISFS